MSRTGLCNGFVNCNFTCPPNSGSATDKTPKAIKVNTLRLGSQTSYVVGEVFSGSELNALYLPCRKAIIASTLTSDDCINGGVANTICNNVLLDDANCGGTGTGTGWTPCLKSIHCSVYLAPSNEIFNVNLSAGLNAGLFNIPGQTVYDTVYEVPASFDWSYNQFGQENVFTTTDPTGTGNNKTTNSINFYAEKGKMYFVPVDTSNIIVRDVNGKPLYKSTFSSTSSLVSGGKMQYLIVRIDNNLGYSCLSLSSACMANNGETDPLKSFDKNAVLKSFLVWRQISNINESSAYIDSIWTIWNPSQLDTAGMIVNEGSIVYFQNWMIGNYTGTSPTLWENMTLTSSLAINEQLANKGMISRNLSYKNDDIYNATLTKMNNYLYISNLQYGFPTSNMNNNNFYQLPLLGINASLNELNSSLSISRSTCPINEAETSMPDAPAISDCTDNTDNFFAFFIAGVDGCLYERLEAPLIVSEQQKLGTSTPAWVYIIVPLFGIIILGLVAAVLYYGLKYRNAEIFNEMIDENSASYVQDFSMDTVLA